MKPEFRLDKYALRWKRPILSPDVTDFLRYTFKPGPSIFLLVSALVAMICIVWCTMMDAVNFVIVIFCAYVGIFLTTMLFSYRGWKRYRTFYNTVFKK